ncbi:hypothetical protein WDW89_24175 [Deltaproteobacteria bacterium TL4]
MLSNTASSRKKGIALLLTLVILVLMAMFLTEFSFETTLEVKSMQNFQSAFQAQSAAKSMFKAVLVGLESEEESVFFGGLSRIYQLAGLTSASILNPPPPLPMPPGLIPDFEEVSIYSPYIRPIDHLFNLNRLQQFDTVVSLPGSSREYLLCNQFFNTLSSAKVIDLNAKPGAEAKSAMRALEANEVLSIYGAIWDWIDKDDEPYSVDYGAEQNDYLGLEPEFRIKNRMFDELNEVRLVKGVSQLFPTKQLWEATWRKSFTIHPVGVEKNNSFEPSLNVNLASPGEIEQFLLSFNTETPCIVPSDWVTEQYRYLQEFSSPDIAKSIDQELTTKEESGQRKQFKTLRDISAKLAPLNLDTISRVGDFFIIYNQWYEIRLITEVSGIQAEVQATIQVERDSRGKVKKGGLNIVEFALK